MTKAYDDLPLLARILLQLFLGYPISAIYRICRYLEKKNTTTLIAGILCIPFGWIFWVIDLITTIVNGKITILAD